MAVHGRRTTAGAGGFFPSALFAAGLALAALAAPPALCVAAFGGLGAGRPCLRARIPPPRPRARRPSARQDRSREQARRASGQAARRGGGAAGDRRRTDRRRRAARRRDARASRPSRGRARALSARDARAGPRLVVVGHAFPVVHDPEPVPLLSASGLPPSVAAPPVSESGKDLSLALARSDAGPAGALGRRVVRYLEFFRTTRAGTRPSRTCSATRGATAT